MSSTRPPELLPTGHARKPKKSLPIAVALLIVSLVIPLTFYVGPLRLSVYRIVLILLIIPSLARLLSGKAGPFRLIDAGVFLMCVWSGLSFSAIYGVADSIEKTGIFTIETFGAYLVSRTYIRTPEQFRAMVKLFIIIALAISPLALYETATSNNITLKLFDAVGTTYPDVYKDLRWGFDRVQGPFEHPILFGVFFGAALGLSFFVLGYGQPLIKKSAIGTMVFFVGALSLSSGPLTSQVGQIFFITWQTIFSKFKNRWYIFIALTVLAYVAIDALSNRTPFEVFVSYFAFNSGTAYNRLLIWQYGVKSIFDNPIFGVGLEEWDRAWFMPSSADMFWIVPAMRHGVLVWALHLGTFIYAFYSISKKTGISDRVNQYRFGYLSSMFGTFVAGWTVHYWNATYVLYWLLLASGLWILDQNNGKNNEELTEDSKRSKSNPIQSPTYTRFPRQDGHRVEARIST
ncbi:hypothetical protein E0K89_019045 [Aquicoccus sp. SCR17]|nr:hypothetical protein [Carideicomes alvinocaridis]